MKTFFSILSFCISFFTYSQTDLAGIVLESETKRPIAYATVFINGTTKGTITDDKGFFILNDIPLPSMLVISHVSYAPKILDIDRANSSKMIIELQAKTYDLSEVKVEDKNLRKKNVAIFKQNFLGVNYWGKNAHLTNDSVMTFHNDYQYQKIPLSDSVRENIRLGRIKNISEWDKDSLFVIVKKLSEFKAEAIAPLVIDMPLLGYKLRIDLIDFTIQYIDGEQRCQFLGYYYFQPYTIDNKKKNKDIEHNRQSAYYNSSQHFFRSLFNRKLAQNGYRLVEKFQDTVTHKISYTDVDIQANLKCTNGKDMIVNGLINRHFIILSYFKNTGEPIDLALHKNPLYYTVSDIYFLSDTCIVRRDGTIPNNDSMFGGRISAKKVGSYLPDEYQPRTEKE
jgi:hypothetical protein